MSVDDGGGAGPAPSSSPPKMAVPATPALDVHLIDTDWLIAGLGGFRCYSNGCRFTLSVRIDERHAATTLEPAAFDSPRYVGGTLPPEAFVVHIRWPSGATTRTNDWSGRIEDVPIVRSLSGIHHPASADIEYWLSPLPPPGRIWFSIEWRSADISGPWIPIDTAILQEAAILSIEVRQ